MANDLAEKIRSRGKVEKVIAARAVILVQLRQQRLELGVRVTVLEVAGEIA
jgi:hypothetical protein